MWGGLLPAVYIQCDGLLKTFSCCHWDPFPGEHAKILCVSLYEHLTHNVCVPVLVSVADIIHLSAWLTQWTLRWPVCVSGIIMFWQGACLAHARFFYAGTERGWLTQLDVGDWWSRRLCHRCLLDLFLLLSLLHFLFLSFFLSVLMFIKLCFLVTIALQPITPISSYFMSFSSLSLFVPFYLSHLLYLCNSRLFLHWY